MKIDRIPLPGINSSLVALTIKSRSNSVMPPLAYFIQTAHPLFINISATSDSLFSDDPLVL